jgi:hypothetical protein
MWSNRLTLGALGVLVIATLLSWRALITSSEETKPPPVIGTNNTALFIISSDYGLTNVHLATAHALLERHPYVKLHFASFAPMEPRIERLAAYGKGLDIQNHGIDFHRIDGLSSIAAVEALGKHTANVMHPPGLLGVAQMCRDMQIFLSPWSGEEHLAMYEQIGAIIGEVNPAVVVLDTALGPAIDATRDKNRLHAFISPNTLIENFPAEQPWGKMFWKYPA